MSQNQTSKKARHQENIAKWREKVLPFQKASKLLASWQLINTLGSAVLLWGLMYWSLSISYWLTIPLIILTAGIYIRTFIIFHDCGHGSFFKSKTANEIFGTITGILTFNCYHHWKWEHALHHATSGHLDKRGTGDVWTMTVEEYLAAPKWKRLAYRIIRNPFVLFGIAPLVLFLILERFPRKNAPNKERYAVYITNIILVLFVSEMILLFGLKAYLLIQLPVLFLAMSAGVWLFYVQHQFDGAYWERDADWDFTLAALQGSSFYKLPKVLQWFTGNIGYHHIHHLSSQIPNYNLEKCHKSEEIFQRVKPLTLWASLKALYYRLWDEKERRLIGFKELRKLRKN